MVEQTSEQGQQVIDYVHQHFYAEYLEGLKGNLTFDPQLSFNSYSTF